MKFSYDFVRLYLNLIIKSSLNFLKNLSIRLMITFQVLLAFRAAIKLGQRLSLLVGIKIVANVRFNLFSNRYDSSIK